jgi:DNA invertase Pin-like site-specific DNA recombinase
MVNKNHKGRKPTKRPEGAKVIKLDADGLQRTEIARRAGIGVASVYRVLADAKRMAGDRMAAA